MAIITDEGIVLRSIEQVVEDNTQLWANETGEVDVSPTSASGEIIAIHSEIEARSDQNIADAFLQNTIQADNAQLDKVGDIKNRPRRENIKTIVYCYITGTNGVKIPLNTELTSSDNNEKFYTQYEVTIASGVAYVSASSLNIGVSCLAGTIGFSTPITGASITNNKPGIVGFLSESDTDYRSRIQAVGSEYTLNLKDGLHFALFDIDGVSKVNILDNNEDITIEGVPARNFAPVVLGGDTAQVAQKIYEFMGAGNPTYGDISQGVISRRGAAYTVRFYRPTEFLVAVVATLTVDATFDTINGYGVVAEIISDYINALNIGDTLYIQRLEAACFILGVTAVSMTLNGGSGNITTSFNQELYTNAASITVT